MSRRSAGRVFSESSTGGGRVAGDACYVDCCCAQVEVKIESCDLLPDSLESCGWEAGERTDEDKGSCQYPSRKVRRLFDKCVRKVTALMVGLARQ